MTEEERSDAELCRLEELAGKALPGPYTVSDEVLDAYFVRASDGSLVETFYTGLEQATYVAAACSLAPSLVAEVRSLRGVVQAAREERDELRRAVMIYRESVHEFCPAANPASTRTLDPCVLPDGHEGEHFFDVRAAPAAAADAPQPAEDLPLCEHGHTVSHYIRSDTAQYHQLDNICSGPSPAQPADPKEQP